MRAQKAPPHPATAAYQAAKLFRTEQRDGWTIVLCGGVAIARAPAERGEDLLRNLVSAEACGAIDEGFNRNAVRWSELRGPVMRRIEQALSSGGRS
jgi:hypothetical protein